MDAEHSQFGMVLPSVRDRLRMLDEACQVMIALWTQEKANFEGEHYQLRDALHEPKAVQTAAPADRHRRQRREGDYADRGEVRRRVELLRRHARDVRAQVPGAGRALQLVGRDPSTIERSTQFRAGPTAEELIDLSRQFIAAGATHLIYTCPQPYSAEGARGFDQVGSAARR